MLLPAALASGLALLFPGLAAADADPIRAYGHEIREVTPGIHVMAQREPFHVQPLGNVTIFRQSDGFVVVDAGGTPAAGRQVADALQRLGPAPLKALVITHWHADHALGAAQLLARWPRARLIATRHTHDQMREGLAPFREPSRLAGKLATVADNYRTLAADPGLSPAERRGHARTADEVAHYATQFDEAGIRLPTEFVEDRLELDDPVRPLSVLHPGPANTPGDLVVLSPRDRVVAVGDIVVAPLPFAFDVDPVSWAGVLAGLVEDRPRVVIPGHGAPMRDTAYASRLAGWLCDAHDRITGASGDRAALEDQVETIAGGDPWLRRWARAYWAEPLAKSVRDQADASARSCPRVRGAIARESAGRHDANEAPEATARNR
ncbi:MBL fold metallo-hydrolase [Pseudoxanthomonas suwonensis]|uniref:MBL fold metallo-hydrolase n=1 Tax=Pseudoxanthomonas suwonensis TaxID=314722 RepID=UPI00048C0270|nr:MBL fold metallo-hydrolase [Pseudoxanthomonas suwonensis]